MAKLVITTVGTSLLEKQDITKVREWIKYKSATDVDYIITGNSGGEQYHYDSLVQSYLQQPDLLLKDTTAEIASLLKMDLNKEQDRVVLLFSDTPGGAVCARANAIYINEYLAKCELGNGSDKDVRKIDGLEVKDPDKFKRALYKLIDVIKEFQTDQYSSNYDVLFNITGGYKGAIPYISMYAFVEGNKIVYFHADGELLISFVPNITHPNDSSEDQKSDDLPQILINGTET